MGVLSGAGFRGVAVSRRGRHGLGPADAKGLRVADYVEDTIAAIEALEEAPILVGHSLGGLVAQKVAEAGRCAGLVLLAPAPAAMLTAQLGALPAYLPLMPKILAGASFVPHCGACDRIALNRVPVPDRPAAAPAAGRAARKGRASRAVSPRGGEQERKRSIDPDLVNDLFRGVHTLKGLAGLFGAGSMSTMSHSLEEVLDDLRLGRIDVTRRVLDVLFKAIDTYGQMLHDERSGELEV